MRKVAIWAALIIAIAMPLVVAAASPLLAWRDPIYIAAGFAGIVAMSLLLVQPLLIGGHLPGLSAPRSRRVHRAVGGVLVMAILIHVTALWITSPPDVIDALLFASPTPFSAWGVIAMWAVFAAALLATLRRRMRLPMRLWRGAHTTLAAVTVIGSVVHALLIDGTMGTISKAVLCLLVPIAFARVVADLRGWSIRPRRV